jgi:hypothetical protein
MNSKFFLTLSVALNIVAIWLLISSHRLRPTPAIPLTLMAATEPPRGTTSSTTAVQQPKPFDPSKVTWVQALREAQISEKVIADVASANFEDHWHALALENQKKFERGEITQAALTGFDLEHDEEKEKEMRAALGDEGFRRWDQAKELADLQQSGVQLSTDESGKLYDLRKGLDRKRLVLDKARHEGKLTDEEAATQSEALYTQYNQQLLKFLGDDRYAQMQNGGDTGISQLKQQLSGLNASDAQVSGMETAQQSWNSQRTALDIKLQKGEISADDYQQQMKALDSQRDQEYQKVLGSDGFAQFQRDQSEQYQMLKRLGPGMGFTTDDINNLYAMMQDYQNGVQDYRNRAQQLQNQGQTVDWSAVNKVLANYAQQTESALRDQLGEKYDKLKRSNVMPFER